MNPSSQKPVGAGVAAGYGHLLTYDQAAAYLCCSSRYVRKLAKLGELKVFRPARLVRIHRDSLDRFISAMSSGGKNS